MRIFFDMDVPPALCRARFMDQHHDLMDEIARFTHELRTVHCG